MLMLVFIFDSCTTLLHSAILWPILGFHNLNSKSLFKNEKQIAESTNAVLTIFPTPENTRFTWEEGSFMHYLLDSL